MLERRKIEGYSDYEIDAKGGVWSKRRRGRPGSWGDSWWKPLNPTPDGQGYLQVTLYRSPGKRKMMKVAQLVAKAFIANPHHKKTVNHKNGDKTDNRVENLEWATYAQNSAHARYVLKRGGGTMKGRMINRPDQSRPVQALDPVTGEVVREFKSLRDAERNGFTRQYVSLSCTGKRSTYKGWAWKYAD